MSNIARAQLDDNFNDGEILHQPEWLGDTADFTVDLSGQLQLNAPDAGTSNLFTPLPLNSMDNIEWTFFIHLAFSPSSTNFARVYLAMDQPDGTGNGYFLQFGEALSNDAVQLFRQDGANIISVCRATDGQIAAAFSLGIKVTRDASGVWTLAVDPSGGTRYQNEAIGAEGMYGNCSWFGLRCTYTTSNANKFYFDDIHVGSISADTIREAIANPHDVLFNEIYFEPTSSSLLPNAEYIELINRSDSAFNIDGWILTDGSSNAVFPPRSSIEPGQFVIISSLSDTALFSAYGKVVGLNSFPGLNNDVGDELLLKDRHGVIIDAITFSDETYHDPDKSNGGWSLERIDTAFLCSNTFNWKASNNPTGGTPGSVNSIAGQFSDHQSPYLDYGFISGNGMATVFFSEPIDTSSISFLYFILIDKEDTLHPVSVIVSSSSEVILNFGTTLSSNEYALFISSMLTDCPGNPGNTLHSIRLSTPEAASPGDIIVNELLYDAPIGASDFIEIFNRADHAIDVSTLKLAETTSLSSLPVGTIYNLTQEHRLIFPGEVMAFTEKKEAIFNHYPSTDNYRLLSIEDLPDFNTEEGGVVLFTSDGKEVDWFPYQSSMQFPLLRDTKGVSLERLIAFGNSADPALWHSAASVCGYATPGAPNSQRLDALLDEGKNVSLSPLVISPDNNGKDDSMEIQFHFKNPGNMLSCMIFNEQGFLCRSLLNSQLMGNDGCLIWDGTDDDHQPVPQGRYVVFAEYYTLSGTVRHDKLPCGVVYMQ